MSDHLYSRIEAALAAIAQNQAAQPGLEEMAAATGMSPHHFQRTFRRWVGISPTKFLQYLTLDRAKACLAAHASVMEASWEAGLSGPGRLHDLFVAHEAVTPGDYKRRGAGLTICYGFHDSPFGRCLLMATDRGICGLAFAAEGAERAGFENMARRWPAATFTEAPSRTAALAERIFRPQGGAPPLPLCLHGTNFQIRVWDALLRIPPGALTAYGDVAAAVGAPRAARAVGAAIGRNPISWLVPCHRVIRASGYLHNYEWGLARKAALIGWEAARSEERRPAAA
ncbi:MAG: methylated-DNA--[protein]-cysteine S-methyltransferase [Alphaproteobacteria bacterium]|nr:methylated-DNA--[protein]-cysteine S-methyltransferase [Alphaproteobacteria bacterium]MCY4318929.1 methylated-DNA--[protein]-cysteine S-methyltransferase [Alphaproteobacteria bacterium]